jgi:putative endonuclease
MRRNDAGQEAEDRAARYLEREGFRLITRNFRTATGEIDLVAEKSGVVCFVEVRYRGAGARVDALSSVDGRKQARLARTALAFLHRYRLEGRPARFDVIGIDAEGRVSHIPSAFSLSARY